MTETRSFKETKGDVTVEACVTSAPGGMFKGYLRITRKRGNAVVREVTGRRCGRPVLTSDEALTLAIAEANRVLSQ